MLQLLVVAGCEGPPTQPSYTDDVAPILEQHCVRCHTDDGRLDGDVGISSYASARSTRIRSACTALEPAFIDANVDLLRRDSDPEDEACTAWAVTSMPPGATNRLSAYEQTVFLAWIASGASP